MIDFKDVEWRSVEGFPFYEVSNKGRIRSLSRWVKNGVHSERKVAGKELKGRATKNGYLRVCLYGEDGGKSDKYIHRLVAEAFLNNPENCIEVNHKDSDKSNNREDNLEWVTRAENMSHAFKFGLIPSGPRNGHFKGKIKMFDKEGNLVDTLWGRKDIKSKGLNPTCVYACLTGKHKTHKGYTFIRVETEQENN